MPENIDNKPTGEGAQEPTGEGAMPNEQQGISDDIDRIFSEPASGGTESGDDVLGALTSGTKQEEGSKSQVGMTYEQQARMFQSKFDKAQADLSKLQPKVQRADSLEKFYNELYENPEVRRAFIAELEPDLVKPKDPYGALEEQLKQEFGEEYVPDDEEARRPFTPSWKYYRRLSELEQKVRDNKNTAPKTLKELREEREQQMKESQTRDAEMKNEVLTSMKWNDTDYQAFGNWVQKLNAVDLAKIYRYVQSKKANSPAVPFLANQAGGATQTPNEIEAELKKFFG